MLCEIYCSLRAYTNMTTGLFALVVLVITVFEASALTTEGKILTVEIGANVSTVRDTLRDVSIIECVDKCMRGTCNMVGYHKPTKTCFISTDMSYDIIRVSDTSYRVINLQGRFISQWVDSVYDSSSTSNTLSAIEGEPDVYPAYRSSQQAWNPAEEIFEFIEVDFSTTVKVTSLEIYETMAGGVVTGIKCFQDGAYHSLYDGEASVLDAVNVFSPMLTAPCVSNRLRIEVYTVKNLENDWIEIDAVRLNGTLI